MIIAEQLTKRYGKVLALDGISFTIQPGEAVALWGSNGAGKTTTLRCLLGLHSFEGNLSVNGVDVRRHSKAARTLIGYVPQEASFYDLTVWETLHFYAQLKKVNADAIPGALERVQLSDHSSKRMSALSGGMKQRLALAVGLLADPPVLVLDEPTANLDAQAQHDFIQMVQALNQSGKTLVFSSHRLDEVAALAKRVLVLSGGKLQFESSPFELAEKLGLRQWLRIRVPMDYHTRTIDLFRAQGVDFAPNGKAVYVHIAEGGKMMPLRLLETARIPIDDFDLVDSDVVPGQEKA